MNTFSRENYPKQYASIRLNDYRLKNYLSESNDELNKLFHELEAFCIERVKAIEPVKEYNDLQYIASGWEYSVFRLNDSKVVKVPAGIFPEVNTTKYVENSEEAYEKVLTYFCDKFTAKTEFSKKENLNIIYQEYIKGKTDFLISFYESNKELVQYLQLFSNNAQKMIEEIEWIPDFDFSKTEKGFLLRNIIVEQSTSLPKIIDTTYYLDQNRMYPQQKVDALRGMMGRISQFNEWLDNKL